jgi:hypothetical protein
MTHLLDHRLDCDVLVAGGGPAGVACALAAARAGSRVVLCQDRAVLGGNASSEVRMHIVGATGLREGRPQAVENREGGIIEEIRLQQAVRNPQRSPSMLDLTLYDLCRSEPNLVLLLNTMLVGVEMDGTVIRRAMAERQSTLDRFVISASVFVDCTGDGRLGLEANAPFVSGREAGAEHGETLAVPVADRKTLGSTLLFQARKHDRPMPFVAPPWVRRFQPEDFKLRPFAVGGSDLGLEYGYWWIEWGGCLDTIKDNERIRDELVAIVLGVWNFIKNESGLDVEAWALDWFGFLPGKRESRRFVGQHVLTESDLLESQVFPDAIAYGGWPIDLHPPEGIDAPAEPPCLQNHLPYLYSIPLRSCVSAAVSNLMFAGRNLSATHVAFASTRVMATCAVVGQGVGTAAAMAVQAGVAPSGIAGHRELMTRIQQRLLRDDCYLVGVRNHDPADLARSSVVTASSSQAAGPCTNVLSGQTRSVHGLGTEESMAEALKSGSRPKFGGNLWGKSLDDDAHQPTVAPPDRCFPGSHRWMSDPGAGLPASIQLRWKDPVRIGQVELIFDTGMHRYLTLTQAEGYSRRMLWGRAQPETVRDYRVEAEAAPGQWVELVRITGNFQRRRTHAFFARQASAIRLVVEATNGADHARVFEIRAYG